jgi:tetratricopeptide (TPR) repeat protein
MHEAVRRYFRGKQTAEQRAGAHKLAVEYYRLRYEQEGGERARDPSVIAELAFHLAASGDTTEARRLKLLIIEEIAPAARRSYREEQNYEKALDLYRLLTDVAADDPQMWAYVGRCYARLGRWPDSDDAFSTAVLVAEKTGHPTWWLYRDWGHIRARFAFYREAEEHLQRASRSQPNPPGINGAFAYMRWRQGYLEDAAGLFEKALAVDPDHHYSLRYYPQVLEALGDYAQADNLRQRLRDLEARDWYGVEQPEYELESEDD